MIILDPLSKEASVRVQKAIDAGSAEQLETPEEIHYFAAEFNWDDPIKPLQWIIRQPICDKGTALLIYWRADPKYFYRNYADRDEIDTKYELIQYDLIKEIEDKILSDFYTHQNLCSPTLASYKEIRLAKYANEYKRQRIPEGMFEHTEAEITY